jgi:hypothetical protein
LTLQQQEPCVVRDTRPTSEAQSTACLAVEACWDGEVLERWTLDAGATLAAGPAADCDLLVGEDVLAERRTLITLDERGEHFTITPPQSALVHEARVGETRDAYRQAAWRQADGGPRRYRLQQALDLRVGPWLLRLRPSDMLPTLERRRQRHKRPIAALIASALVHALLIAAALAAPPVKRELPVIPQHHDVDERPCFLCKRPKPLPKTICLFGATEAEVKRLLSPRR